MGGYRGKLGPTVGYMWNGIWCVRARPEKVPNPKTQKQNDHRTLFKQEVQLASTMHWVVEEGLTATARERRMTGYNLFVKLNQQAFSLKDGQLAVDYTRLQVAAGGLAPVAFGEPVCDKDCVLSVTFAKNPTHGVSDNYDSVKLYIYCPDKGEGFVSNGDYRRTQRCSVVLPEWMLGHEVHIYGYVRNSHGFSSDSQYIGSFTPQQGVAYGPAQQEAEAADVETVDPETGEIIAAPKAKAAKATAAAKSTAGKKPVKRE